MMTQTTAVGEGQRIEGHRVPAGPVPSDAGRFVLHRVQGEPFFSQPGDVTVRTFLERLVRERVSLEGIDLDRLADDLARKGALEHLDPEGRIAVCSADLRNADLRGIKASKVDFSCTDMSSSWLDDARMSGCSMIQTNLRGVRARRADLSGAMMAGALMGPDKKPPIDLPPGILFQAKEDEGRAERCFLGTGINLHGANLDNSVLEKAKLAGADLRDASMCDCGIEECVLDGARFDGLDLKRSAVTGCSLVSESVHLASTAGSVMRNNAYARIGNLKSALLSPSRLFHLGRQERAQRAMMSQEMRRDYDGSVVVSTMLATALPLSTVAFGMTDRVAEDVAGFAGRTAGAAAPILHHALHVASLHAPGAGALLASTAHIPAMIELSHWAGVHAATLLPMAPAAAMGLAGVWVLKKMVEGAAEPLLRGVLERGNEALGFLRSGRPGVALGCLVGWGSSAERLRDAMARRRTEWSYASEEGCIVVVGEHSRLGDLLRRAGLLDPSGHLPGDAVTVRRDCGPGWPQDSAPQELVLSPGGGGCKATWYDADGGLVRSVLYDGEGTPSCTVDALGVRYGREEESDADFSRERDPIADFMAALVQDMAPHDGRTHVARSGSDGAIVIRRASDGVVDNPHGPAAVGADGSTRHFQNGRAVEARKVERPIVLAPGMACR